MAKRTTTKRTAKAVAALKAALAEADNKQLAEYFGRKALTLLPADGSVDRTLVRKVLRIALPSSVSMVTKIPAAHAADVLAELPRAAKKLADATYLWHYAEHATGEPAERLGAAVESFEVIAELDDGDLAAFAKDPLAVAAACAAVAAHGAIAQAFLPVLAHVGDDVAIDAMVSAVGRAVSARDDSLDDLATYFVPHARGKRMRALADEIESALAERTSTSPLLAIASRWGDKPIDKLRFTGECRSYEAVGRGDTFRGHVWFILDSHASPRASILLCHSSGRTSKVTEWKDGTLIRDELKLRAPDGVADLPRWLAAAATKLGFRWYPHGSLRANVSLRGKQKRAAQEWLFPCLREPSPAARTGRDRGR